MKEMGRSALGERRVSILKEYCYCLLQLDKNKVAVRVVVKKEL
jgi:hypothetical protein